MSSSEPTTDRLTEEQLAEIVRRLVDALSPQRIYLFGSYAYGSPTPDSDLDVMVIVPDEAPDRFELSRRGYASLRGVPVPVELHFCRTGTFERFRSVVGSFHREVRQRGRVIYAA